MKQFTIICTLFLLLPHILLTNQFESDRQHNRNRHLASNDNRIIGGRDAVDGEIPYIVSIQRQQSHACGGSIVNEYTIITAGHCVDAVLPTEIQVRYNSINHASGGELVEVQRVIVHPGFDSWTLDYDIALLKLKTALNLTQLQARAIQLPSAGQDPADSATVLIAGWGRTVEVDPTLPETLQTIEVPVVSRDRCRVQYGVYDITERMICAGFDAGGRDACQGDSGGPLVSNNILWGIISWGSGCARPNYYGVYTRVGSFVDWIYLYA